jgi:hypothetical protein
MLFECKRLPQFIKATSESRTVATPSRKPVKGKTSVRPPTTPTTPVRHSHRQQGARQAEQFQRDQTPELLPSPAFMNPSAGNYRPPQHGRSNLKHLLNTPGSVDRLAKKQMVYETPNHRQPK